MRVPFSSYLMQRGSKRIRIIHHRAHRVHRGGGERGSYFFKNSLSLGLFLCVLCDLRGEFSEKFSHVQQISTISTRRFSLNGCNMDKGCWATEQCMPDICNA